MKRGQITLMVIIGVILLFTVSSLLYVSRISYSDRLQAQAAESVNEFIESHSLNQYVTSCVQRVGTQGLRLLGKQGGVLYDYQGGLTPTTGDFFLGEDYFSYFDGQETYNVSYAIKPVSQNYCLSYYPQNILTEVQIENNEGWQYPVPELFFTQFQTRFQSFSEHGCLKLDGSKYLEKSGYLGYANFPFLCTPESAADYRSTLFGDVTCDYYHQGPANVDPSIEPPSIEEQLEAFIKTNMPDCFDPSIYEEQGDQITVDIEHSNVSVYFLNPKGILINSQFPFEVALKGEKPIIEFVDFQQKINLNFLDTYNYLHDLFSKVMRDPFFHFQEDYKTLDSYKPSFEINLIKGSCEEGCSPYHFKLDDILSITDTNTDLSGEPYTFFVALKQEKPALDYINNPDQNYRFTPEDETDPVKINFLFYEGETMNIPVQAVDPNDDQLTFSFSGWKETEDTMVDVMCCADSDECTIQDYSECELSTKQYPTLDIACCQENYPAGCNKESVRDGTTACLLAEDAPPPQILSKSFTITNGMITYSLDQTDIGFHRFTINVTDEHGATDYQQVNVLVYDSPLAVLTPTNGFDDIPDTLASIEDIYTLEASESRASVFTSDQALSRYVYRVPLEDFELKTESETFTLPNETFTFKDILPKIFRKDTFYENLQEISILTEVSLQVEQDIQGRVVSSPEVIQEVTLYECLPHGFSNPGPATIFYPEAPLDFYNISPYDENGEPYYQTYTRNGVSSQEIFDLPHVCCQPQPQPINGAAITGGGIFADTDNLCYQNLNIQTCYPFSDPLKHIRELLGNPVIEDASRKILTPGDAGYVAAFGSNLYPTGDDPYRIRTVGGQQVLGDGINDIYTLELEQSCSGDRGNICSGNVDLQWDATDCEDFTLSNQYARCTGPGLPAAANTQEGYVDKSGYPYTYRYFGDAFPSTLGDFSCQGGDATYTYNISLSCNEFGYKQSFEKSVLKVSSSNTLGLNAQTALAIEKGYCAGPIPATIFGSTISAFRGRILPGPFACYATCGGDTGCEYQSINDCTCGYGDPLCNGIEAKNLLADDAAGFTCVGTTVCGSTCDIETNNDKAQCYCQLSSTTDGAKISSFSYDHFEGYFGDKGSSWDVNGIGDCCVEGSHLYAVSDFAITSASVCFDGSLQTSGRVFSTVEFGDNALLSYRGQVHYCSSSPRYCADPAFTIQTRLGHSFPPTQECLTLDPSTGDCFYEDEDESPCIVQPYNRDPILNSIVRGIGTGQYIEDAYNIGGTLGGYECTPVGWRVN
ncbi:MAG: hypothetical protein KC535_00535 [Nanoarchaeota archaeon]|nr:hypothetical protein [Nanoarchaeota archaeon]